MESLYRGFLYQKNLISSLNKLLGGFLCAYVGLSSVLEQESRVSPPLKKMISEGECVKEVVVLMEDGSLKVKELDCSLYRLYDILSSDKVLYIDIPRRYQPKD